MADAGLLNPPPIIIAPQRPMVIPTSADELQKVAIGHIERIHREFRHANRIAIEFVVPTKRMTKPPLAQRRFACRNQCL